MEIKNKRMLLFLRNKVHETQQRFVVQAKIKISTRNIFSAVDRPSRNLMNAKCRPIFKIKFIN